MSVVEVLQEQVEQIGLQFEDDYIVPAQTPPVVKLTKAQESKFSKRATLRVRDSMDAEGDMMFELSMLTYDRRALDDLAERYNLNLVFINEHRDYERENLTWQPTETAA